jgi:hypothetical protein
MSYGLIVRDASNNVTFSSEEALGGVYACSVIVPGGTTATVAFDGTGGYPDLRGRVIRVVEVGAGSHIWTVTQGSTPYVTVTHRSLAYWVWASTSPTILRIFVV